MAKKSIGIEVPEKEILDNPESFIEVVCKQLTSLKAYGILNVGRSYTLPKRIADSLIKEGAAAVK